MTTRFTVTAARECLVPGAPLALAQARPRAREVRERIPNETQRPYPRPPPRPLRQHGPGVWVRGANVRRHALGHTSTMVVALPNPLGRPNGTSGVVRRSGPRVLDKARPTEHTLQTSATPGGGGGATPRFWTPTTPPQLTVGRRPLLGGGGGGGLGGGFKEGRLRGGV